MKTRARQVVTMMGVGAAAGFAILFGLRILPPRGAPAAAATARGDGAIASAAVVQPSVERDGSNPSMDREAAPAPRPRTGLGSPSPALVSASPAVAPVPLAPPFASARKADKTPTSGTAASSTKPAVALGASKATKQPAAKPAPTPFAPSGL